MLAKKPIRTKEDFINGTKARVEAGSPKPDKSYLVRLPHDVWAGAKGCAAKDGVPLYQYIINAVREKNESFEK
jgi:hypothetical protein